MPKDGKDDPDMLAAWNDMNDLADPAARQQAFVRAQTVRAGPRDRGAVRLVDQGAGDAVKREGFVPFRIPRMSNVWFTN